jgi:alcohol dehydrogenase
MNCDIPLELAAFHNPLANGFEWTLTAGGVTPGDVVAVLGAGPRGLGCALAALYSGAIHVTLVGLGHDAGRLELAKTMGVQEAVVLHDDEPSSVLRALDGARPRVVVDTTPRSKSAVHQAVEAVEDGGTIVLAGIKGEAQLLDVSIDRISRRRLTLRGPFSRTIQLMRLAVEAIERGRLPLGLLTSKAYPLEKTAEAIEALLQTAIDRPWHVRVEPYA